MMMSLSFLLIFSFCTTSNFRSIDWSVGGGDDDALVATNDDDDDDDAVAEKFLGENRGGEDDEGDDGTVAMHVPS